MSFNVPETTSETPVSSSTEYQFVPELSDDGNCELEQENKRKIKKLIKGNKRVVSDFIDIWGLLNEFLIDF